MERKALLGTILAVLLISMLRLEFDIPHAKAEETYCATAHAHPVLGETAENHQRTKIITVLISALSEVQVGVKAGDWIKYNFTFTGVPSETSIPTWMKVEFLSVEGKDAIVRATMHMSDGTEQNQTTTLDISTGSGTVGAFSGLVIPANSATGDSIYLSEYGNITIAGEAIRTYAGASRTVVYATFSHARTRYFWDKQTGVMVEASVSSGGITVTAEAIETSMWGITPFWMQWWFWAIIAAGIGVLASSVYLKKRKTAKCCSGRN